MRPRGLAACGGGTTKTVTVTKTVTAPASSTAQAPAPATTPPNGEDTTTATTPGADGAAATPLPAGIIAADGRGLLAMRRELGSGAFNDVTLDPDPYRAGRLRRHHVRHHRVRDGRTVSDRAALLDPPHGLREVNGASFARRMDVEFTEVARGYELSARSPAVSCSGGNREA